MQVCAVRSLEALATIKDEWEELQAGASYFRSFEYHHSFLAHHIHTHAPLILTAWDESHRLLGLLPMTVKNGKYKGRNARLLEFGGTPYTPLRGGLGRNGLAEILGTSFADYLLDRAGNDWEVFSAWDASLKDPLTRLLLSRLSERKCFREELDQTAHIAANLSQHEDDDHYFQSLHSSFRRIIRKGIRSLAEAGSFQLVVIDTPELAGKGMERCREILGSSWKAPERDELFFKRFGIRMAELGKLRLFFLCWKAGDSTAASINEKEPPRAVITNRFTDGFLPIAVNLYMLENSYAFYMRTHYRLDYARFSPGILVTWFSLQYLLQHQSAVVVDFQRGAQDYKTRFGGQALETLYSYSFINSNSIFLNTGLRALENARSYLRPIKQGFHSIMAAQSPRR